MTTPISHGRWRWAAELRRIAVLALTSVLGHSAPAAAAPMEWRAGSFTYVAEQKPLAEMLRDFAAAQGVPVVVDPGVQGTVNAKFNLRYGQMMELLASTFGLIWYFDGSILHVYPAASAQAELIRINGGQVESLVASLERLKINDPRYPLTVDQRENALMVSGPPRYVEMVKTLARVIEENTSRRGDAEIRVFPLKHAWAADTVFSYAGGSIVMPGVASTLQDVFSGSAAPLPRPAPTPLATPVEPQLGVLGQGGRAAADPSASRPVPAALARVRDAVLPAATTALNEQRSAGTGEGSLPRFRAEGRLNAVVVRDLPERMHQYETLIARLDVRAAVIEIEVNILDVVSTSLQELGIDWRFNKIGSYDVQTGTGTLPQLRPGTATAPEHPLPEPLSDQTTPAGGLFTILSGNATRYLIARVNALEQKGDASVRAQPRLLTLDNVEAVLDDSSTFYVRVNGTFDANLFGVTVGTAVRVTPLLVAEVGGRGVKLAVRIEDGGPTGERVDAIPVVRRSTIGTQAFIEEGQSLLVAGYSRVESRFDSTGLPYLSRIPVLGALFRTDSSSATRTERLFMVTPRVVSL